jgi:hypothetical protein
MTRKLRTSITALLLGAAFALVQVAPAFAAGRWG